MNTHIHMCAPALHKIAKQSLGSHTICLLYVLRFIAVTPMSVNYSNLVLGNKIMKIHRLHMIIIYISLEM